MRTKLFVAILLLAGLALLAQTVGEITGQVGDPSGAGVPNAVLTLTNTTTNAIRQADSNEQGLYTFPSVPPGIYNIKVEHPGFKTTTSNNVEVQVQQTVRLDFTLQVGQVSRIGRGFGRRRSVAGRKRDPRHRGREPKASSSFRSTAAST